MSVATLDIVKVILGLKKKTNNLQMYVATFDIVLLYEKGWEKTQLANFCLLQFTLQCCYLRMKVEIMCNFALGFTSDQR